MHSEPGISRDCLRRVPRDVGGQVGVRARVEPMPLSTAQASRICTVLLGALLALTLLAETLPAQGFGPASSSRQGFWASLGAGQGGTWLRCGVCADDRKAGGLTGHARAGTTVSDRLLVGVDLTYWRRDEDDILEQATGLAGAAYWYPRPEHGYYLKLGLGYSWYRAAEGDIALTTGLMTAVFGAGYEMRVNHRISLVPFINLLITAKGDLLREDARNGGFTASRVAADLSQLALQVGFGITRH